MVFSGCGGGGGGGGSAPPPNPLYVRVTGKDTNLGDAASPLRTISKAVQIAQSNYQIIVSAGTYTEGVTTDRPGKPAQALMILADGNVVVDATGTAASAGFKVSGSSGTLIDGFTITGGGDGGIVIKTSNNVTVQNCVVRGSGDGIRVQDSATALVFNNLVYSNSGVGIGIVGQGSGSENAHVINNTIFGNGDRGILIGTTQAASPAAFLRNNILQSNGLVRRVENIKVTTNPRSDLNYDGDFNLVFPTTYLPASIKGNHDVSDSTGFLDPGSGDFHLPGTSPAIGTGASLGTLMTFDQQRGRIVLLQQVLVDRTTTGGNNCDQGALDLGFHTLPTTSCTAR